MVLDRSALEILDRSDCLTLLAGRHVGRVAFSRQALPVIVPVNYAVLHDGLVFAARQGSGSLSSIDSHVIALEVDNIDSLDNGDNVGSPVHRQWSVLVVGVAHHVTEHDPKWQAALELDLRPCPDHEPVTVFSLSTEQSSGRQAAPVSL